MFNSLIASGLLLSAANVLAGCLGYVYQSLMGRMLQPEGYASFSSIMALTVFFGAPLGALVMVISRQVSHARVLGALRNCCQAFRQPACKVQGGPMEACSSTRMRSASIAGQALHESCNAALVLRSSRFNKRPAFKWRT